MEEEDPSDPAFYLPSLTSLYATSSTASDSTLGRPSSAPEAPSEPSIILSQIQNTRLSPVQLAALSQALLNQQQTAHVQSRLGASTLEQFHTLDPSESLASPHFEHIQHSSPSLALLPSLSMPFSRLDGLNELQLSLSSSTSSSLPDRLTSTHLDELINARNNLDIWASTVFQSDSPTPFFTPPILPDPSPSLHASLHSHGLTVAEPSFDWTTLYPQSHSNVDLSIPPLHSTPPGFPVQSHFPSFNVPPLSATLPSIDPVETAVRTPSAVETPSAAPSPRPSKPSRSRRASRAPSRQDSEGGVETPTSAGRELMTNEELEEDKRRRNTEASGQSSFTLL